MAFVFELSDEAQPAVDSEKARHLGELLVDSALLMGFMLVLCCSKSIKRWTQQSGSSASPGYMARARVHEQERRQILDNADRRPSYATEQYDAMLSAQQRFEENKGRYLAEMSKSGARYH